MLLLLFAACAPPAATPATGIAVSHDAAAVAAGDFWAAPWPWDGRRRADGTAELAGFPNPDGIPFVADLVGLGHATLRGAGTTSGIFFRLEGPGLDPERLPSLQGSLAAEAGAYLVDLDPSSPERGRRIPISSRFQEDAGPFGGSSC